jgi:hypothetical protein
VLPEGAEQFSEDTSSEETENSDIGKDSKMERLLERLGRGQMKSKATMSGHKIPNQRN